jgi:DNA-binding FadR family transcriptional regulator
MDRRKSDVASETQRAPRPKLNAIKRTPLLYQIQEEIKRYIVDHQLKPGDSLPSEGELARQLDISRNSVREAVKSLEVLGIVASRPGSGLFVKDFSFDSIINNLPYGLLFAVKSVLDVLEVRAHLEYGMVERVIQEVTSKQLHVLGEIVSRMKREADAGRYSAEDDRAFHEALYMNVDNLVLLKVLDIFWLVVLRARELAHVADPASPIDTYHSHKRLLEALESRDVEQMRAAFDHHYGRFQLRLRLDEGDRSRGAAV